ncbi:uncharacterized protein LOC131891770 isoform X2 [Tigriopus californicus]|nr:uncharacterized protein LOC131891770 isoform X2 [Tigriopus californicus]
MIVATCLMVSLVFFIHGQMVNSYAIFPHIGTYRLDRGNQHLEMDDESSGTMPECNGEMSQEFNTEISNLSGCFNFQTPGFNDGGYPNNTMNGGRLYVCRYVFQFGAEVTGTVTVKKAGFELQAPTQAGNCVDAVSVTPVTKDLNDPEERGQQDNFASFCGVISEDKSLSFSSSSLSVFLVADATVNGNGAEIETCFD